MIILLPEPPACRLSDSISSELTLCHLVVLFHKRESGNINEWLRIYLIEDEGLPLGSTWHAYGDWICSTGFARIGGMDLVFLYSKSRGWFLSASLHPLHLRVHPSNRSEEINSTVSHKYAAMNTTRFLLRQRSSAALFGLFLASASGGDHNTFC